MKFCREQREGSPFFKCVVSIRALLFWGGLPVWFGALFFPRPNGHFLALVGQNARQYGLCFLAHFGNVKKQMEKK